MGLGLYWLYWGWADGPSHGLGWLGLGGLVEGAMGLPINWLDGSWDIP